MRIISTCLFVLWGMIGCAGLPETQEMRWTDEHLAQSEPAEAPNRIERVVISAADREKLQQKTDNLLQERDKVGDVKRELQNGENDADAYAAKAREQAQPPDS